MRYVALLRGVNVGGKRRVPMVELRQLFVDSGFDDVSTYINSGNVIFSAATKPVAVTIQAALEARFGFTVDCLILSGDEMRRIAAAIPSDWTNDPAGQKSDVVYLFDDVDSPDIIEKIGYRPEVETLVYVPHAVLSNLPRKNQPKSSLLRCIGTPLYRRMTVRNITTARKLAELVTD